MILKARTNNGTGDAVSVSHDGRIGCNPRLIWADGDFRGATLTFEHSFDNGASWKPANDIAFTAPGVAAIYLVPFELIRGIVAGGDENNQSISADYI